LPTHALKIAIILAALDWKNSGPPDIEVPHLARAIQITESWRASLHRAIVYADQGKYGRIRKRITDLLIKDPISGVSLREICKGMRDQEPQDITKTLEGMVSAGDLVLVSKGPGPKGGRPTDVYKRA
jgi:hypothetical protein